MQFIKRNLHIGGRTVPALQISEPRTEQVTLPSGRVIPGLFADCISLRETNPDGPNPGVVYLTMTPENLRFTTLRFTQVEGLDVDENGGQLTLEVLEARRAEDIEKRQLERAAQQTPTIVTFAPTEG